MNRVTKDGGDRRDFPTGAQRDSSESKPSFQSFTLEEWQGIFSRRGLNKLQVDTTPPLITGMDPNGDKGMHLIHPLFLNRLGAAAYRGAQKYGEGNWELGIPLDVSWGSLGRHWLQAGYGDTQEGHWEAIAMNAMFCMVTEHKIAQKLLPRHLATMGALAFKESEKD